MVKPELIWSCPTCGTDLADWWCDLCERLWSPVSVAAWDPPDYQHPEDDDD